MASLFRRNRKATPATRSQLGFAFDKLEERAVPATFTVTTLSGAAPDAADGLLSLSEAITGAIATPEADTITFGVTGNITITAALPAITSVAGVTITGPGADKLTILGGATKVFNVAFTNPATFSVSGLTIGSGVAGIVNTGVAGSTITANNVEITGIVGKGIDDGGVATTVNVSNSTIAQNTVDGITLTSAGSNMNLTQSTISTNGAKGVNAAAAGTLVISQSTIFGNTAEGLANPAAVGSVTMNNTVVANNKANTGDVTGGAAAFLGTSANNFIGAQGAGTITSLTSGVLGNTIGVVGAASASGLGNLGSNGGATRTHLAATGSALIDKGGTTTLTADQRGFARVTGAAVDIGATESGSVSPQTQQQQQQNQAQIDAANAAAAAANAAAAAAAARQATFNTNLGIFVSRVLSLKGIKLTAVADVNGDGFPEFTVSLPNGKTPAVFQIDLVNLLNSKRLS